MSEKDKLKTTSHYSHEVITRIDPVLADVKIDSNDLNLYKTDIMIIPLTDS